MRHNRLTHRFNRSLSERKAMLENLVTSLLKHQAIKTTLPKAKETKKLADRIITLGKRDTLAARRQVFASLQDHQLTSKVFKEVAPRFKNRNGGYTRILQLSRRKGDGAQLALLELTEKEIKVKEVKKISKKESKAEKPAQHSHEEHKHEKPHDTKDASKPKQGFFNNLGKFFRNKGGS